MEKLKTEELLEQYYDVEYTIEDMMSTPNLQENFENENYQKKLDELREKRRAFIAELKRRNLQCFIANSQSDLYF